VAAQNHPTFGLMRWTPQANLAIAAARRDETVLLVVIKAHDALFPV